MGLNKGGNMGLLDFIFGKDPEWMEVTEDTFSRRLLTNKFTATFYLGVNRCETYHLFYLY